MLVLTRKLGESIVIDGNITFTVVEIKGKAVRLGIDAPKAVRIHREELTGHNGWIDDETSHPNLEKN